MSKLKIESSTCEREKFFLKYASISNMDFLHMITMTSYSLKLSQGTLTVEASAKDPQTAKDLFNYALDKSGLIPKD
jgi:hypothetical protein